MIILSFDCGSKNFGVVALECKDRVLRLLYDSRVTVGVTTYTKKNHDTINRAAALKSLLRNIDAMFPQVDHVLVEYQMKANDITRLLSSQVVYHYCKSIDDNIYSAEPDAKVAPDDHKYPTVHLISPTLKKKIVVEEGLEHKYFAGKYSNYTANKKHATANLEAWLKKTFQRLRTGDGERLADIADAFCQAYMWLQTERLI